jgi:hypothetical protein
MPSKTKRAHINHYSLYNEILETTEDSKYLGVTINNCPGQNTYNQQQQRPTKR